MVTELGRGSISGYFSCPIYLVNKTYICVRNGWVHELTKKEAEYFLDPKNGGKRFSKPSAENMAEVRGLWGMSDKLCETRGGNGDGGIEDSDWWGFGE